jgi:hypothetical protein
LFYSTSINQNYRLGNNAQTSFTVIVKPSADGPAIPSALSSKYIQSVTDLNNYNNSRLLGYIDTKSSTRQPAEIQDEAREYASWRLAENNTLPLATGPLTLHGLYFDNQSPELGEARDTTDPDSTNPAKDLWNVCDYAARINEDDGGFGKVNAKGAEIYLNQMVSHILDISE